MFAQSVSSPIHPDASPSQIQVRNPVTGLVIGSVPNLSRDEVRAAAERARAAQPAWEALGVRARAKLLLRWADILWSRRRDLVKVIRRESGKTDTGAMIEIIACDAIAVYLYQNAPRILRPRPAQALFPIIQHVQVQYKAHGVVGIISPWNYPLMNAGFEVIPALIAGNTVLIKPSELSPYSALLMVDMLRQAGIPQDVVQVVTGDGATGSSLVDVVDYVHVTGSTATGRRVAVRAAERLIPYSLELGGKDPMIVLRDTNLDVAATGALTIALENAGQACLAVERIYVEAAIYERFVERLRHHAQRMKLGAGDGYHVNMGSLTHERELLRTEQHIADALAKGARLVFGGKRRPDLGPLFFEPTILADVDHSMTVMQEETFGPIVPVMRVKDAEEAIALANDTPYGLSASIYTKDLERGKALAHRIRSGDVGINRAGISIVTPAMPSGGEKDSGIGRRNGPEGLLRFVRLQSILVDRLIVNPPTLELLNPLTLYGALTMRQLRRWIPFI